jgi:queuine tRNA-ribosyltransferase
LHYKAARHARELDVPLDPKCGCYACKNFSRAYLRHLFAAGEILALELATLHSVHFYQDLMRKAREKVLEGNFEAWSRELLSAWAGKNETDD